MRTRTDLPTWENKARCGEIKIDDVNSPAGLGGARRVLVGPDFPYFAKGSSMAFGGVGLTQIEQFRCSRTAQSRRTSPTRGRNRAFHPPGS